MGASVPPVATEYGMGESVETAVMTGAGSVVPKVQDMARVVPSETDSRGALLFSNRLMGTAMSAASRSTPFSQSS